MPMSKVRIVQVAREHRAEHAGGGGELRDDRHLGEAAVDRAERRAGVEAEPAEPAARAPPGPTSGMLWPGNDVRLAVLAVLALARAEQQQRRERAGGADQVHHRGAGEVLHAEVGLEPAAAEDPVADDRVDQRAEDHRVDQVGAELDALERGAPDDRERDGAERRTGRRTWPAPRRCENSIAGNVACRWCRGRCPRCRRTSPCRRRRARSRPPSSRAPRSRSWRGSSARPCPAFFMREKPTSRNRKPTCMNMTRIAGDQHPDGVDRREARR